MALLLSWLALSIAVWLTALLLPGFRLKEGLGNAVVVAALFGVLNATLGVLLFHAIGIGTLFVGYLLAFVTRAVTSAIVLVVVDGMSDRLDIDGFKWALGAAVCMNVVGGAVEALTR